MTYNTIDNDVTMAGGAEGALLANRYRIVRLLGQGGMGSVWLAEDTQLDNKQFAIKMLPSILVSNKRAYNQLKSEALVAMKLVHPNIVQLRAFEENGGNPFLVMDYIDGETLDDHLADAGNRERETGNGLPEAEVVRILKPIAAALDYAHGKGVVHRDVKPGNVMIAKDGTPFILDFGIAREIQETMTRVTGKLSSGTLLYMSPEQLHGAPPKKAQDIYSFAAMAYECLKGEPPFSRGQIEYQIDNDTPAPLDLTGEGAILATGVMQGLSKKPENRPPTCVAILDGKFSRVEHVGRVEKGEGGARSDDSLGKVFAVLALLTVLVAGGYYEWTKSRGVQEKEERIATRQNVPAKHSEETAFLEPKLPAGPKIPAIDEADIIEIRVKAAKCENAMGRISDEDGFALKKAPLSDDLAAARAYDNSRSWGRAAAAYTNYVNSYNALAHMNKDRIDARSKRSAAGEARQSASDASASQYAHPRWNEAERLFNAAKDAWSGMDFPDSAKKYDLAAKQFGLAKDDAVKERDRQARELGRQRAEIKNCVAETNRQVMRPLSGRYECSARETWDGNVTEFKHVFVFKSDGTMEFSTSYGGSVNIKETGRWSLAGNKLSILFIDEESYSWGRKVNHTMYGRTGVTLVYSVLWKTDGSVEFRPDEATHIAWYKKFKGDYFVSYYCDNNGVGHVKLKHGLIFKSEIEGIISPKVFKKSI